MKNTTHFGFTDKAELVTLGVGAPNADVANLLADNAESVAALNGAPINIVALLDINDLYKLREACTTALNALDNEALAGEVLDYGLPTDEA